MDKTPIAIVAALDDEIRVIRSKMDIDSRVHIRPALVETGKYMNHPLMLVRSGVGKRAMAAVVGYAIQNYRPAFCLHVGYCGGADPQCQPGDLVLAAAVADRAGGLRHESDAETVERARRICRDLSLRAKVGNLVTVDNPITAPHEKAFIGTECGAQGIDMESFAFADICRRRGVSHLVVRAVLDPLDVALPSFGDTIDKEGRTDGFALVAHLVKRPRDIFELPRVRYFANEARGAITAFVDGWIENRGRYEEK